MIVPMNGIRLCTLILLIEAVTAQSLRGQSSALKASQISAFNGELIQLADSPDAPKILTAQLARLRFHALSELLATDPKEALRLALPESTLLRLRRLAPALGNSLEEWGEWSGPAEVTFEDDFVHGTSRTHTSLTHEGAKFQISFANPGPAISSGTIISIKGLRVGEMLGSRDLTILAPAGGTCSTIGQQKIAVLLVNFSTSQIPSTVNSSYLNSMLFGSGTPALNTYWAEASSGKVSATGDVFGPFNLGKDYTSSQYDQIRDDAITAAASSVTFANYNYVIIIMPPGFPIGGGLGTLGCTELGYASTGSFRAGVSWLRSDFVTPSDLGVCATAHENGHNLGLNHASTESYGSIPVGSFGSTPVIDEYGDRFSLMGLCYNFNSSNLLGHYAAPHKVALGWMTGSNYQSVSSSGSFTLAPTENNTSGLQALRVERGVGNNRWLWIEYRQSLGYDAIFGSSGFSNQVYAGAVIHYEDPSKSSRLGYTHLLNYLAPSRANDFTQPALPLNTTWSDPYSLLTLNINSGNSAGLNVAVTYDTPCATLTPNSRTYSSAGAVASDTIAVSGASSCSWTAVSNNSWISITGGASGSGAGTVTYSLTANPDVMTRTGSVTIGRHNVTLIQASSNPQPIPVSSSPASGSAAAGVRQMFTFVFSDGDGATDIVQAGALFNSSTNPVASCNFGYYASDNGIRLYNDTGLDQWTYGPAGLNATLSNSQCLIDLRVSTLTRSPNNLTLTVGVTFLSQFTGLKNIYLQAKDTKGAGSGLLAFGSWTVNNNTPQLSISKSHSGNLTQGQISATYNVTVSNQTGAAASSGTVTVIETIPAGLSLVSMSGTGWNCASNTCTRSDALAAATSYPPIIVTVNVASNAASQVTNQVSVSGGGSAAGSASDLTTINVALPQASVLTIPVNGTTGVVLTPSLNWNASLGAVTYDVYLGTALSPPLVTNQTSSTYNPVTLNPGTTYYWKIVAKNSTGSTSSAIWSFTTSAAPPAFPLVNSISPAVSSGATQQYTVQFSHANGYQSLGVVNLLINNFLDGRQACYLAYSVSANVLYIVPDNGDGAQISGKVMNGTGTIANSQCSVNLVSSTAIGSGNVLTLNLTMSFFPSFGGNKVFYMAARDTGTGNSGWLTMGTHGVPPLPSTLPNPAGMSPSSGNTTSQAFTITFQDATSATNLQTGWMLVNTAIDGRGACYVAYYRPGNQIYLYPDNGDGSQAMSATLTGTNSVSNSQCTISALGSSVVVSGGQLQVTLNVTFKSAFTGRKGVWMAVQTTGGAQTSAWQAVGAWAVP